METTDLGAMRVSRLAFGGCPMGRHGWGNVSRSDFIVAIRTALDMGLNLFDTADVYGLGEGELTLGDALAGRRDEAIIATKFGVRVENGRTFHDNSPAWARTALEASLRRLKTDYVDLYQIHYRDGVTALDDITATLLDLQQEGKIRALGLSNIGRKDCTELLHSGDRFISVQDEFSLANRSRESDLTWLRDSLAYTSLTWGSLGQGILTGKYDARSVFDPTDRRARPAYVNFHGQRLLQNLRIVDVLRDISRELGRGLPAVAIRWILDRLDGSVAIVGIKTREQLHSNLEALGWALPEEAMARLDSISDVREDSA